MTIRTLKQAATAGLFLFALLLGGCGEDESESQFGEWTMMDEALSLTEELVVSETDAFYFGSVSDLDVTSDGRMVVADRQANNIKVLRPDGSLVDTLGRSGEGPGEFQMLSVVRVVQGDSLFAYDFQRSRLTVYAPASPYEVARMVSFPREQGFASTVYLLGDTFVGRFGGGAIDPEDGLITPDPSAVRRMEDDGTPSDTLLLVEPRRAVLDMSNGGIAGLEAVPFDRRGVLAQGSDDRLYYGSTDSLHIEAFASDGSSEVVASIPVDPVPVTAAARDSALSDVDKGLLSSVESAMPETKPSFTDLVVASDGRLWVQRPQETPGREMVTWWVLDPENQTIRIARLPEDVSLLVVKDDRAYGRTTTENGAPAVVRYSVEIEK